MSFFPNFFRSAAFACVLLVIVSCGSFAQAPSTYSAYTGTDAKTIPPAPALGPANSVINDPTFGSQILRVTDPNSNGGESFVPTDSGFHRSWNADSTAIKLTGPHGDGWWLEFNPSTFQVGNGSSSPTPHPVSFGANWEWSAVDPNIIYFLNGNQIASYNKATGATTNLGGPPTGEAVDYMAVVIGQDNWVCAAAGNGVQDSYTEIYCVNPTSPGTNKFIDVYNGTINGVSFKGAANWPTSASGEVIGIHDISGGTGSRWLEVTFHQQSWGANGGAVLDLGTNTWSEITNADEFWSGHVSMGNGTYANSSGSQNGDDSRGMILRDPDNAMNAAEYRFVGQPAVTNNGWCDADHISWLNSMTNPNAPILVSRYYSTSCANGAFELTGEIYAAAVDGSGTIYRFAHNHDGGCYYGEGFAQISNDGNWALFSSYWDGNLGPDTSFGCQTRIDTFIVKLSGNGSTGTVSTGGGNSTSGSTSSSSSTGSSTSSSGSSTSSSGTTSTGVSAGTSSNAGGSTTTTTPASTTIGGSSVISSDAQTLTVGYGQVAGTPNAPAGMAIFGYQQNGVLVSQAGVPATGLISQGRLNAEVAGSVNTGFAIANPSSTAATLSFYFTDTSGNQISSGSTTLPAGSQMAKFLSEAPFSAPQSTTGTFTFSSNVPVSAVALRGYTNERSEFLVTTIPITDTSNQTTTTMFFPHFAWGGGWSTEFDMVNPSDAAVSGTLSFFQQGATGSPAPAMSLSINGQTVTSVSYSIPPRSSQQFVTTGVDSNIHVGSATVTPAQGPTPGGNAVFSFVQNGVTVSQAGVPLQSQGTAFRMYIESSPSVQSGIAVLNNGGSDEQVVFDVTALDGTTTGLQGTVVVPAGGQRALFVNQIQGLAGLPQSFKGIVRVSTSNSANIVVFGLRGQWNQRNEFLVTTTTPTNEAESPKTAIYFPQIVDGGGYTTQFVQYSGTPAEPVSGNLQIFSQSGSPLTLSLQ